MSVAAVTYLPHLWDAIHPIKLFMSVMYVYASDLRLALHSGEKWTFSGHSSFLPKVGFTSIRLSLSQWLKRKPRSKAQILTFSVRINEAYYSLLEDRKIIFILSVSTIIL